MSDACSAVCRLIAGIVLGAGAALAISGCSATTDGTASTASTRTSGCAVSGYSASAATATVRCYLNALRVGDAATACGKLSIHARGELLARARDAGSQGLISISTSGSGCATVAVVIQHALDDLTPSQHAELEHRLRVARVGVAQVTGSTATVLVTVPGERTTQTLVRGPVTWQIDSMLDAG